ncbi:MAG: PH domain-containing protein [Thermodesulfobacteriota bacterium]
MTSLPEGKEAEQQGPTPEQRETTEQNQLAQEKAEIKEEVFYDGRLPLRVFHLSHNILWLLLLGWNVGIFISLGQRYALQLKITSMRIVVTTGLVSQHVEQVDLFRVVDIERDQSVLDRIFGVGTIVLYSEDKTSPTLPFRIANPGFFAEKIKECVFKERRKRRAIAVD